MRGLGYDELSPRGSARWWPRLRATEPSSSQPIVYPDAVLRRYAAVASPSSAAMHGSGDAGADASVVRFFRSRRGGGNGELRRLVATVRSRSVVVLARWNGHSATRKLRRVCRRYGVEYVLEP